MTHICVGKITIIVSDNGLSPERRQAIIWTNAGILLIGLLGTNFCEILIEIHTFSFKKMHWKYRLEMAAILSRPQGVKKHLQIAGKNTVSKVLLHSPNLSHTGQNGWHFSDDIFRCIFLNEKFCSLN